MSQGYNYLEVHKMYTDSIVLSRSHVEYMLQYKRYALTLGRWVSWMRVTWASAHAFLETSLQFCRHMFFFFWRTEFVSQSLTRAAHFNRLSTCKNEYVKEASTSTITHYWWMHSKWAQAKFNDEFEVQKKMNVLPNDLRNGKVDGL